MWIDDNGTSLEAPITSMTIKIWLCLAAWYVSADKIQIHADCWPTSLKCYPILTEPPDLCYLLGYLFHRHLELSRWVPLDWHTKALLPRDSTFVRGLIIERKCDHGGITIWRAKVYPIFDPRESANVTTTASLFGVCQSLTNLWPKRPRKCYLDSITIAKV